MSRGPIDDPRWYQDALVYQLHVKAFRDGNADGVGDFTGLTAKLDYLQELGVTALWLLPFYPSPLRDDGYDIADYRDIHPSYGTLDDFRAFLEEAHRRGLRVITELVINHTSDQHPWFQRARRAPAGSPEREFYVWSDDPDRYAEARIIFQDFESSNWTWDPVAGQYFWHRFYHHQPDLNFDNPAVGEAVMEVMDFWFEMGVDGLRLDAVPYLFEREGTNCENLPETHAFLKALRRRVDDRFPGRMLLAEANQWPEDAVAYFGDGDECHMAFHFPIMPRLFMGIRMEDRFPVVDILEQTPPIPDGCQWAVFLRNHDELTLEMVTDEERDYMYRVYATDPRARINLGIRRRLAPLLQNNRKKIELMMGLLLALPGTPILYYGDEIGMGDNIYLGDRNGVRTPMQWSGDRNAGFSEANPQKLYLPVVIDPEYRYEAVNVESQRDNPSSLLWWVRRIIALRKRFRAFGRGTLRLVRADNPKVLAFLRECDNERILAVFNLSRFVQAASIELPEGRGEVPVELFGGTALPPIGERPYPLTLAPHAFYWFGLRAEEEAADDRIRVGQAGAPAAVTVAGDWTSAFEGSARERLHAVLPAYLAGRRWFGAKSERIRSAELRETIPFGFGEERLAFLCLVDVSYRERDTQTYFLPLAYATGEGAESLVAERPGTVVCRIDSEESGERGVLVDATAEAGFARALLAFLAEGRRLAGGGGARLEGWAGPALRERWPEGEPAPEPSPVTGEQSNTSLVYGDRLILKLFRRVEPGTNPDVEVNRFLTERGFPHTPPVAGGLDIRRADGAVVSAALLQAYVPNEGDAWPFTLDTLSRFYERAAVATEPPPPADTALEALLARAETPPEERAADAVGPYLESARLLGRRTAEMHAALASGPAGSEFAPEPFSELYQRALYQSMRNSAGHALRGLEARLDAVAPETQDAVRRILGLRDPLISRFRAVTRRRLGGLRIRIHGDYHLGQVLHTGRDFVVVDFEGEPTRPLGERRLKRSGLRDVAGMIRSFHYASQSALRIAGEVGLFAPDHGATIDAWGRLWYSEVSARFLEGYLGEARGHGYLPEDPDDLRVLLEAYLLEKALYEVGYELNSRPAWIWIPARGVLELMGERSDIAEGVLPAFLRSEDGGGPEPRPAATPPRGAPSRAARGAAPGPARETTPGPAGSEAPGAAGEGEDA